VVVNAHDRKNWGVSILLFSNEGDEPPHVHVQRERMLAKFWLTPVALASASGYSAHEQREIERIVTELRQVRERGMLRSLKTNWLSCSPTAARSLCLWRGFPACFAQQARSRQISNYLETARGSTGPK